MDHGERQELAAQMTQRIDEVKARMSRALAELGFPDLEVTEFRVSPSNDDATVFRTMEVEPGERRTIMLAAPCPSVCVLTPDGQIRCFPQC